MSFETIRINELAKELGLTSKEVIEKFAQISVTGKTHSSTVTLDQVKRLKEFIASGGVKEAKKLGIPVFAMLDTNCDPDDADYPIASNDDANRSVKLVITLLADAIVDAKSGLLELAYLDETEDDVTMEDVIKNVEQQIAENERRRRQRNEERRKRNFERKNRRFNKPAKEEEKPAEKPAE